MARALVTGLGSGAGLGYAFSECKYDFEHNLRHGRPVLRRSKQAQEAIATASAIGSDAAVEFAQAQHISSDAPPAPAAEAVSPFAHVVTDDAPAEPANIVPEASATVSTDAPAAGDSESDASQ